MLSAEIFTQYINHSLQIVTFAILKTICVEYQSTF